MGKKSIIIAIVGSSGSGKTLMSEIMETKFGIPSIVSYTTRPPREGETNGKEHWFVDSLPQNIDILAYTVFGGYQYWTTKDQIQDICTYVIDEYGLSYLKTSLQGEVEIISVLVCRKDTNGIDPERLKRDEGRLQLAPSDFNYQIENDSSVQSFIKDIEDLVINIKQNKENEKDN